jgi:hypothetical protein
MRSEPASDDARRHWTLTRTIAQALSDAGVAAIEGTELGRPQGESVDDAAGHHAAVFWDVDFLDKRVSMKDYRRLLVIRFPDNVPRATLVQRLVDLLRSLKDEGSPINVIVLEPMFQAAEATSLIPKHKRAA